MQHTSVIILFSGRSTRQITTAGVLFTSGVQNEKGRNAIGAVQRGLM